MCPTRLKASKFVAVLDDPLGTWMPRKEKGYFLNVLTKFRIVSGSRKVGEVEVTPPSEFVHLLQSYYGVTDERVTVRVELEGKRAYLCFTIDREIPVDVCLFYWTQGSAPWWLPLQCS